MASTFSRSPRHTLSVSTDYPANASRRDQAAHLLAIGGPIGFIPWVPATWASLLMAVLCWKIRATPVYTVVAAAGLLVGGGYAASVSERLLQSADPRNVVVDEFVGQLLAFSVVRPLTWKLALAGFVFFRLFDVTKPWPARAAERLPGGWGVMMDDVVAGLYAAAVLWVAQRWVGAWLL